MAGVKLTPIGVDKAEAELVELINRLRDPAPALREIGEDLDLSHRMRWDRQQSPDGSPWEPLSLATVVRKAKKGLASDILVGRGDLRNLLRYAVTGKGLQFGTDRVYGATQHFGRGPIPARPWLGMSDSDRSAIVDIIQRHLTAG